MRIAAWSGPRNISTALLRSWGNRPDTYVCDEPFYAHYLKVTGRDHPGRDEILIHHESDPNKVIAWLTGPIPEGKAVFYQKQMGHHLTPGLPLDWISQLSNVFLIRDPEAMLISLTKVLPHPTLEETGLPQQWDLFQRLRSSNPSGETPPVIDSRDVLADPKTMLGKLCDRLGLAFDEAMLRWPEGPRPTDGIWAKHWYANVEKSTGFVAERPRRQDTLDPEFYPMLEGAQDLYAKLAAHKLT